MRHHVASTAAAVASIAATMLFTHLPAAAEASLDYSISSISCALTGPGGATSAVPCSTTLWHVSLEPGWSATMAVTFDYHYTDDGLPVDGGVLIDVSSGGVRATSYESAGLYFDTIPVCPRGGGGSGCVMAGSIYPVFVSENRVADDVTASTTLTITAAQPSDRIWTWGGDFGLVQPPIVFVNSVPEPSTWALFGVSLAAVALVHRRRGVPRGVLRGARTSGAGDMASD